jgi:uncharacterized coiled-coil protein SlyX
MGPKERDDMTNVPRTAEERAADREKAKLSARITWRRGEIARLQVEIATLTEQLEARAPGRDSTVQNGA